MDGPDGREPVEPPLLAPVHEPGDGAVVGLAGVGVTDGDGEEVDEAPGGAVVGRRRSWAGAGLRMRRAGLPGCPGRAVGSWIVLIFGGIRESYKKTIITTFMKGFIYGVVMKAISCRIIVSRWVGEDLEHTRQWLAVVEVGSVT